MAKSRDYRVRLGKLARELATDRHGQLKGWNLERAIEALQNKPPENGSDYSAAIKVQLNEFNLQLRATNAMIAILISELDCAMASKIQKIDDLGALLQAEAASRSGLEVKQILTMRDQVWHDYDLSYQNT